MSRATLKRRNAAVAGLALVLASSLTVGEIPGTRLQARAQPPSPTALPTALSTASPTASPTPLPLVIGDAPCYGGGIGVSGDVEGIRDTAATHGYFHPAPDTSACKDWGLRGYVVVVQPSVSYESGPPVDIPTIVTNLAGMGVPFTPDTPLRLVLDEGPGVLPGTPGDLGFLLFKDGTPTPQYATTQLIPVSSDPTVLKRVAVSGPPPALPAGYAWMLPTDPQFPIASNCDQAFPNGTNITALCHRYEATGQARLVTDPPPNIDDPLDNQDKKFPYVMWAATGVKSFRDTGRTKVSGQTLPNGGLEAPNLDPAKFHWVYRGRFTDPADANASVVSQTNVADAPDLNRPIPMFTVRGFIFDDRTMQLWEFERRGVPAREDDPSEADTRLLFLDTTAEITAVRPDLAPYLASLYGTGDDRVTIPTATVRRVNMGGGNWGASPPPSVDPNDPKSINKLIAWSRENQVPITSKFNVQVRGNMATVNLGVARPNKRHSYVEVPDPADPTSRTLVGRIDPRLDRGMGAGDISAEDTTTFTVPAR